MAGTDEYAPTFALIDKVDLDELSAYLQASRS
jgi:hypothetical protein